MFQETYDELEANVIQSCGMQLYDDYKELKPGAAKTFEKALNDTETDLETDMQSDDDIGMMRIASTSSATSNTSAHPWRPTSQASSNGQLNIYSGREANFQQEISLQKYSYSFV